MGSVWPGWGSFAYGVGHSPAGSVYLGMKDGVGEQGRGTVGRLCGVERGGFVGGTRTTVGVGVLEWGWGREVYREQGVTTNRSTHRYGTIMCRNLSVLILIFRSFP